jgi:hypothetical protein
MSRYVYPARECPSYQRCGAPLCPLDPDMHKRVALPGEDECRARRSIREAIAARYPGVLRNGGLKASEIARDRRRALARARWEAMSEEERKARLRPPFARGGRSQNPSDLP